MTKVLAAIVLILAAFWSGVLGFWASDRSPPVKVLSAEAINSPVRAGQDLLVRWDIDRLESCHANVDRMIVDEQRVVYTLEDVDFKAGLGPTGHDYVLTATTVPQQAGIGPAKYRVVVAYRCNPTHAIWPIVRGYDIPFMIRG